MGSFNTTCAVSKLPIGVGDKVKLFFLIQNPYTDSINCYSNDGWNLFGLPIDAEYDDYGRYVITEEERNLEIWECCHRNLKERMLEVPNDLDSYRKNGISRDAITFETLQDAIWEGQAYLIHKFHNDPDRNLTIQVMAIHKDIYESMSQSFTYWRGVIKHSEKLELLQSHELFESYLNIHEIVQKYDDKFLDSLDEDDEDYDEEFEKIKKFLKVRYEFEFREKITGYDTPQLYEDIDLSINCNKSIYRLMQYTLAEYAKYGSEFISKYIFECNMSLLNHAFTPVITSGQDYNFLEQIKFHENIISLARKLHNEHENWDD